MKPELISADPLAEVLLLERRLQQALDALGGGVRVEVFGGVPEGVEEALGLRLVPRLPQHLHATLHVHARA